MNNIDKYTKLYPSKDPDDIKHKFYTYAGLNKGMSNSRSYDITGGAVDPYKAMYLEKIHDEYGPFIDGYPCWHPLVTNFISGNRRVGRHKKSAFYKTFYKTWPQRISANIRLDHTIYFKNAIITCPYLGHHNQDITSLLAEVNTDKHGERDAYISIAETEEPLYNDSATSIIITCEWDDDPVLDDGTFSPTTLLSRAIGPELCDMHEGDHLEAWENIHTYFIGRDSYQRPHNWRANNNYVADYSCFVNKETTAEVRRIWEYVRGARIFGPMGGS